MRVVDLKALVKEQGLRSYSKLKKAELIAFLREPCTRPPPWEPRLRPPPPAPHTRPPPQPPIRPRQELKPYQLKPKRGKKTFIEPPTYMEQEPPPPTSNLKQIKCMKKS